jgi:hypothetical protein
LVANAKTVWKTISDAGIKAVFEAIYQPNNTGSAADTLLDGGTPPKTVIPYTSGITDKVLRLFHVSLGTATTGDKVYIAGTALPEAPSGIAVDGSALIVIDVGQPGTADNAALPTFYIPHQGLGDPTEGGEGVGAQADNGGEDEEPGLKTYAYIRLRVNSGAHLVLLADNSAYEAEEGGAGHASDPGYFHGGCVEVMAGGKLRDGAYEGFPLGDNAVILNRTGSYLAVGPEGTTNKWYLGWLIGPSAGTPRIVWDTGNAEAKYIEVRPTELAIDANVTVKKTIGLIYSVWFVGGATVTIDAASDTIGFDEGTNQIKGLAVNDLPYKFYGNTGSSIIVKKGSAIMKYPLTGVQTDLVKDSKAQPIYLTVSNNATGDATITPVTTGDGNNSVEYADNTDITGYNKWNLTDTNLTAVGQETESQE